jgi:hypothetical protein
MGYLTKLLRCQKNFPTNVWTAKCFGLINRKRQTVLHGTLRMRS